jgi:hypothetical protein
MPAMPKDSEDEVLEVHLGDGTGGTGCAAVLPGSVPVLSDQVVSASPRKKARDARINSADPRYS